jgi:hypothetical protein
LKTNLTESFKEAMAQKGCFPSGNIDNLKSLFSFTVYITTNWSTFIGFFRMRRLGLLEIIIPAFNLIGFKALRTISLWGAYSAT